jgi:hypothetical protein
MIELNDARKDKKTFLESPSLNDMNYVSLFNNYVSLTLANGTNFAP